MAFYGYGLGSPTQEVSDPVKGLISDSIKVQLVEKTLVRDFVESFREVEEDDVHLAALIQTFGYLVDGYDELRLAGSLRSEAMLVVCEDFFGVKVVHDLAVYDVF